MCTHHYDIPVGESVGRCRHCGATKTYVTGQVYDLRGAIKLTPEQKARKDDYCMANAFMITSIRMGQRIQAR